MAGTATQPVDGATHTSVVDAAGRNNHPLSAEWPQHMPAESTSSADQLCCCHDDADGVASSDPARFILGG
jgi:hypothetical protein